MELGIIPRCIYKRDSCIYNGPFYRRIHNLEVNRSGGFRGGSSVKIAYNSKEYYTGIPTTRCKTEDVEKLAYYYDAKNDAIFEESELNRRYVVFYFILFLCSLLLWLYPEVTKRKEPQKL